MSAPMPEQPQPSEQLHVESGAPVAPAPRFDTRILSHVIAGQPLRRWLLLAGAGALAVWGVWATRLLVDLSRERHTLVQVRLSEIVGDYVQKAARSSLPADEVSRQTARFLKVLNDVVGEQGSGGRIVLLGNAVVSGDLPDITQEVTAQVYARVSRPIPAAAVPATAIPVTPIPLPSGPAGDAPGEMRQVGGSDPARASAGGSHAEPR